MFQDDTEVIDGEQSAASQESAGLANMTQNELPAQPSERKDNEKCKCKKRKLSLEEERREEAYQILKASVRRDDCSVYGEHVANELRKLAPRALTIAKHKINNILFEATIGNYDFRPPAFTDSFNYTPSTSACNAAYLSHSSASVYTSETNSPSLLSQEDENSPSLAPYNDSDLSQTQVQCNNEDVDLGLPISHLSQT